MSTSDITYVFSDMQELASYFQKKSDGLRKEANSPLSNGKPKRQQLFMTEAVIWEQAAHIVRNARIDKICRTKVSRS